MTSPADVSKLPAWQDDTIYQWTFRHSRKELRRVLVYPLVGCLLFPALICGSFWVVSLASPALAFWLSLGTMAFFVAVCGHTLVRLWLGHGEPVGLPAGRAASQGVPVAIFAMAALAYVLAAPGQVVGESFQGAGDAGVWQWFLFWLDNALSLLLLDIPHVFQLRLTSITPDGPVSRFGTALLRLLIAAGIVEVVVRWYRLTFRDERFHGTMEECYWKCEGLSGPEQVEVVLEGRVQRLPERRSVNAGRIIDTFKERARQTG